MGCSGVWIVPLLKELPIYTIMRVICSWVASLRDSCWAALAGLGWTERNKNEPKSVKKAWKGRAQLEVSEKVRSMREQNLKTDASYTLSAVFKAALGSQKKARTDIKIAQNSTKSSRRSLSDILWKSLGLLFGIRFFKTLFRSPKLRQTCPAGFSWGFGKSKEGTKMTQKCDKANLYFVW